MSCPWNLIYTCILSILASIYCMISDLALSCACPWLFPCCTMTLAASYSNFSLALSVKIKQQSTRRHKHILPSAETPGILSARWHLQTETT